MKRNSPFHQIVKIREGLWKGYFGKIIRIEPHKKEPYVVLFLDGTTRNFQEDELEWIM